MYTQRLFSIKRVIVMLFLLQTFLSGFAQSDFRAGYYITWDNDTIHGLIDYRGEIRNSSLCMFQKNDTSESVKLDPNTIQAYRFTDSKYYISKKLKTNEEEKQVFVEYLINGIANLYFYRDLNNYIYLIEGKNGEILELKKETDTKSIEGKKFSHENRKYIHLLKESFADCQEIQTQIDDVFLTHKSLISITKNYHDYICDDEVCIIYEKQNPKAKLRIAPLIGVGVAQLHFDKGEFSRYKFDSNSFPMVGILFNISLPKWNEKLSLNLEADLNKYSNHGFYIEEHSYKTDYNNATINTISFQPSLALKYTFPKGKIRPTIAAGFYSNILISKDQKIIKRSVHTDNEYIYETFETPLASNIFGVLLQIGCNYQILNNHTFFTNLRICQTALKEAGISTILNSVNFSVGMYITKDN